MHHSHIFIDDKKITVKSAKFKKNDSSLFVVRTDVFGQLNFLWGDKNYYITMDDKQIIAKFKYRSKDIRTEMAVFIVEQELDMQPI